MPVLSQQHQVGSCRDRVGTLRPQSTVGSSPFWDMACFVLNCLLSLDALRSIWFKGEHLPPCNLWLPGGLRADSGIFASCSLAVSTADHSLLDGVGSRGQPRDSSDSGRHGRRLPTPLGILRSTRRGRAWAPFWVNTQVWLSWVCSSHTSHRAACACHTGANPTYMSASVWPQAAFPGTGPEWPLPSQH